MKPQVLLILFLAISYSNASSKMQELYQTELPLCKACRTLVDSIEKQIAQHLLKNTNNKFPESTEFDLGISLKNDKKTENIGLIDSTIFYEDIEGTICSDVIEGRDQCKKYFEEHSAIIKEWFTSFKDQPLFKYLCVEQLKICCSDLHYGPNCTPCPGYPSNVCSNNGKCKGAGTRKGNGHCQCDVGYKGVLCESCDNNYYESYKDDKKLLCSKCHVACKDGCTQAGTIGCKNCKPGWISSGEKGCLDVNECAFAKPVCSPLQFCVNTDGSHNCLDCDRSCAGCTGDGPDMCIRCANGFMKVDNMCVDSSQESRRQHVYFTRYLTYFGLCVCTCIIFQKNMTVAAIIGLAVAVYISMSEYILNAPPKPNTADLAEQIMRSTGQLD